MNALDYSIRSNQEQTAYAGQRQCSWPGCTRASTGVVSWRSTASDPVLHRGLSCTQHRAYYEHLSHVESVREEV